MSEDAEPTENISGGAEGWNEFTATTEGEAGTRAEAVVDRLGELYWQKAYGGRDAFECLVRTILSQNTSDKASQPAHDALMDRYGGREARSASEQSSSAERSSADRSSGQSPRENGDEPRDGDTDLAESLAAAERSEIAETISGAGLYNQKSEVIQRTGEWVLEEFGSETAFDEFVQSGEPSAVRERLLSVNGVGPKTADCVLLFSGGRGGVFPVDTHVHRIARRLGVAPADADHEAVRAELERAVSAEKCGFGHTAMIQFGREYCTARKPACLEGPDSCPMEDLCDQVGVYPATGEVEDPADAAAESD